MLLDEFRLDGKTVLLAGPRWPAELASPLAAAGARLAFLGPDGEVWRQSVAGFAAGQDAPSAVETVALADSASIEAAVGQIERRLGAVDVLVNSWLVEFARPALDLRDREWEHVLAANLTTPFYLCRAVGRRMVGRERGCIVNVVSGLASRAIGNAAATCASLAGLLHLTRALAVEWGQAGVRVNGLGVGWMETPDREFSTEGVTRFIPLKRLGCADELGGALVYLCSDASSLMTGEVLFVDGGLTAHA